MYDTAGDAMLKQMINLKTKKTCTSIKVKAITEFKYADGKYQTICGAKELIKTIAHILTRMLAHNIDTRTKPINCTSNPN